MHNILFFSDIDFKFGMGIQFNLYSTAEPRIDVLFGSTLAASLFSRYYEEFQINRKTGESNLTQLYLQVSINLTPLVSLSALSASPSDLIC